MSCASRRRLRDRRIVGAIAGLSQLAEHARDALAGGDLVRGFVCVTLGIQQELDPGCSNPPVDA